MGMASLREWQLIERDRIQKLTNKELYDEFIELAGGDDYEGEFTRKGTRTHWELKEELDRRLSEWLKHR